MRPEETRTSAHKVRPLTTNAAQDRLIRPKPTAADPVIISASELRNFMRCRVKWQWSDLAKLEQKRGSIHLEMGSVVHNMLELWYQRPLKKRTVKGMERVAKKVLKEYDARIMTTEDYELVTAMATGYAEWSKPLDEKNGLVACDPEKWFELPLNKEKSIYIRGKIDNVFKSTTNRNTMSCMEFKTKKTIKTDMVETLLQLSVYLWAMRQMYPKAKRYIAYYTILRKQMPTLRVTTPLFHMEPVERSGEEIDLWAEDAARAAMDMFDAAIYPNPTDNCSWDCDFRLPCLSRANPDDLKFILEEQYQPKVYR